MEIYGWVSTYAVSLETFSSQCHCSERDSLHSCGTKGRRSHFGRRQLFEDHTSLNCRHLGFCRFCATEEGVVSVTLRLGILPNNRSGPRPTSNGEGSSTRKIHLLRFGRIFKASSLQNPFEDHQPRNNDTMTVIYCNYNRTSGWKLKNRLQHTPSPFAQREVPCRATPKHYPASSCPHPEPHYLQTNHLLKTSSSRFQLAFQVLRHFLSRHFPIEPSHAA